MLDGFDPQSVRYHRCEQVAYLLDLLGGMPFDLLQHTRRVAAVRFEAGSAVRILHLSQSAWLDRVGSDSAQSPHYGCESHISTDDRQHQGRRFGSGLHAADIGVKPAPGSVEPVAAAVPEVDDALLANNIETVIRQCAHFEGIASTSDGAVDRAEYGAKPQVRRITPPGGPVPNRRNSATTVEYRL